MALAQVTVYATQIAKQRLGYQAISLTNYNNDLEPQIAAGSKVEIGSALFEAAANESISGWAGIGTCTSSWSSPEPRRPQNSRPQRRPGVLRNKAFTTATIGTSGSC